MQKSLAQTFNETAAKAYEAFPEKLKRLIVLLVPTVDTPVYVSPEAADELTGKTAEIKIAIAKTAQQLRELNAAGFAQKNWRMGGVPLNLITLLDAAECPGHFTERFTRDMRAIFFLDHEIGHHILRNGFSLMANSGNMAESAADSFAMLRHIQRFGKNTDQAGHRGLNMASSIVLFDDIAHYTTYALRAAVAAADEMGESFYNLSLQETAELAAKIADDNEISLTTRNKLRHAYRHAHRHCKDALGDRTEINRQIYGHDAEATGIACREALIVMIRHQNDADIFEAGKQFFDWPPVRQFITEAAKTESHWKQALDFIDSHIPQPREAAYAKAPRANI